MRILTRAAATAVAALAASTALATPAAASLPELPSASGCVTTYLENSGGYLIDLDGFIDATVQIGGIPGPVTVNPAPAIGLGVYIVLNEAGHVIALVRCIV